MEQGAYGGCLLRPLYSLLSQQISLENIFKTASLSYHVAMTQMATVVKIFSLEF